MYRRIKRMIDFVFAFILLHATFSFLLLLTLFLFIVYRSNPFFCQKRIGKNEKIFTLLKFKTMQNEQVLGQIGVFLRRTNLDELPQLIHIVLGQMSFVGPRPLLPEYLMLFSPEQKKRHSVLPGLTGLVQVSGGNALSWQKRFELDLEYIEKKSFKLDFIILIKTFLLFFKPSEEPLFSEKFGSNDDNS